MESNDRNEELLHANIEAFAAALDAGHITLDGPEQLTSLLVVLDGSEQDVTSLALARELMLEREIPLTLTCGILKGGEEAEAQRIEAARATLEEDGLQAEAVLARNAENYDRILEVLRLCPTAWLILPCPFGHEFGELSHTTLGTTVEVCLIKALSPTLLVRGPLGDAAREPVERPELVLRDDFDQAAARAAEVALGLLEHRGAIVGRLTVTFIQPPGQLDEDLCEADIEEAIAAGYDLPVEQLMPLLGKGLSSLLHRLSVLREQHAGLELETRLVRQGGEIVDEDIERGRLHILPLHAEASAVPALIHEFVLTSTDAVLVVPRKLVEPDEHPAPPGKPASSDAKQS